MVGSEYYYGGSDAERQRPKSSGVGDMPPPPPYASTASTAAERSPLLNNTTREPRTPSTKRENLCVVIAITALHLVAGFYAFRFLLDHWGSVKTPPVNPPTYNVAIIGGGPAGIAAAQHLHNTPTARDVRFNITIFESKPVLGGMLALHNADGLSVFPKDNPMRDPITAEDITGRALLWSNALFTQDSERILEDKVNFVKLGPEQIAYYRNTAKTVSATRPYRETPMGTWLHLLWAYGSSIWKGDKLAQDGILRQAILKVPLRTDIEEIFASLGVMKPLKQQANAMLKDRGISDRYANEVLEPQVQRAYGQSLSHVTGLAAMMAAAGEESANAYAGGDLVDRLQRIVHEIDVNVRASTRVNMIRHTTISEGRPAWLVRYQSTEDIGNSEDGSSSEIFDKVIMAALDFSVQLENSEQQILNLMTSFDFNSNATDATAQQEGPCAPVHVTFFTSEAKLSPWDHEKTQILFLEASKAAGMRELALVREIVDYHSPDVKTEYLYRVLSQQPVLGELQSCAKITWSYETRIENAYPLLSPLQRYPPFELPWANGLWWTSTIQRAATSVDLNWLAGKIAAQDLIREVTEK
ncbi:hypothetical protein GGR51DRAFT_515498 [Nemania sp. FL0031]|nr:hypothetical protein GGR51DRAFT_515498 [Nemania sp. FL0031]